MAIDINFNHTVKVEYGDSSEGPTTRGSLTSEKLGEAINALNTISQELKNFITKGREGNSRVETAKVRGQEERATLKARQTYESKVARDKATQAKQLNSQELANQKKIFAEQNKQDEVRSRRELIRLKTQHDYSSRVENQKHYNRVKQDNNRHRNRMTEMKADRDFAMRNSIVSSGGLGIAAIATALSVIGRNLGNAQASYQTSNALVRPDIAYSQLVDARMGTGASAISSLLVGGGFVAGDAIGNTPGAIIGALAGGLASAVINYIQPQLGAGIELKNAGKYFAQNANYFGPSYKGLGQGFYDTSVLMPGGNENMQQMQTSYYGSVGSPSAFGALTQGSTLFAQATGNGQNMAALIPYLGSIAKSSGAGASPDKIGTVLERMLQMQLRYGGDTVQNLQTVVSLLQSSILGKNTGNLMSAAYATQAMNPAMVGGLTAYASSDRISQFVKDIQAKAFTGYTQADVYGLNGKARQQKAIAKVQSMAKHLGDDRTLTSADIGLSVAYGSQMWPIVNAKRKNLDYNKDATIPDVVSQSFKTIGAGGILSTQDWMNNQLTEFSKNTIQSQQSAVNEVTTAISIGTATLNAARVVLMAPGGALIAQHLTALANGDNS